MSSDTDDKSLDEQEKQESPEGHATEGGFGTGLRAQLLRRLNPEAEEPPAPVEQAEAPLVSYDVDATTAAPAGRTAAQLRGRGAPRHARGRSEA